MGKISILTASQKKVLAFVNSTDYFIDRFYFTDGTALSEYYLYHRYSEDLDFFSELPIDQPAIFTHISRLAKILSATVKPQVIDERLYLCLFNMPDSTVLKVDFCYYPYKQIKPEKPKKLKIAIDSLYDIAVNKLSTINQRASVKDFVDLYYLIPKFGIWDLTYGVEKKFRVKFDPILLSSDLLLGDKFDTLPRMIKPLKLDILRKFFRALAVELAEKQVER